GLCLVDGRRVARRRRRADGSNGFDVGSPLPDWVRSVLSRRRRGRKRRFARRAGRQSDESRDHEQARPLARSVSPAFVSAGHLRLHPLRAGSATAARSAPLRDSLHRGEPIREARLLRPMAHRAQLVGLLAVLRGLAPSLSLAGHGFFTLLGVAVFTAAASALANNLPVTAAVATLLTVGPASYAALIGLTVGALATPHGSVATMIASDLAGEDGELRLQTL